MTEEEEGQYVQDETNKALVLIQPFIVDIVKTGMSPVILCRALALAIGFIIGNRTDDLKERMQAAEGVARLVLQGSSDEEKRTLQ